MTLRRTAAFAPSMLALVFATALPQAALSDPLTANQALHLTDTPGYKLAKPPLSVIRAGDLPIRLERTTLKTVQGRFGGALHSGGDAGDGVTWICYASALKGGAVVYWFLSNNEMGGGTRITQVAVQRAIKADRTCGPAPARLTGLDFGLPSIGSRLGDVQTRFGGKASPDGYLGYSNSRSAKSAKDPDTTVSQSLEYHFAHGVADIVSGGQVTAD